MLRRVSSVPVLANYYLYRCSTACGPYTQVAYYSTTPQQKDNKDSKDNKDKSKQPQPPKSKEAPKETPKDTLKATEKVPFDPLFKKKPPPPNHKLAPTPPPIVIPRPAPRAAPSTAPKSKETAKLTAPTLSTASATTTSKTANPNLPTPHTAHVYENIHPVYDYSKTQEDRVLGIEDLVTYVTKNKYKNDLYKDTEKVGDASSAAGKLKEKKFSLYGVFDGHQGQFAAEYVKTRLPHELVLTPEFAAGEYEAAIKKAYAAVQKALLASGAYAPEQPKYDFTSGTTASIVLVTPSTTYLAQLGNTPILAKKHSARYPLAVFPQLVPEDIERLRTSNMFLMVNYAPVSDTKEKRIHWNDITAANGDYLHGVSNINTLGSLGDSLYEPANINRYLEAMRTYRETETKRNETEKKRKVKDTNDHSATYDNFVRHVRASDAWKALKQHVVVANERENTSWLTNGFLEGTFEVPPNIQTCGLRREPQVMSIPNSELQYVNIVTDGILTRKFQEDKRALKEIDRIALKNAGKDRGVMGVQFADWFFGNYNDDISSVIISYQK